MQSRVMDLVMVDGAETTRIKAIDFRHRRQSSNGAGKRLARRGAAAGIDVIANARQPRCGSLAREPSWSAEP